MTREKLIEKYESIIEKWEKDSCLKEILPDKYKEIKYKLEALKLGLSYRIYDATDELRDMIIDMVVKMRDNVRICDSMLGDVSPSEYEYKTDMPILVDAIIKREGIVTLYANNRQI